MRFNFSFHIFFFVTVSFLMVNMNEVLADTNTDSALILPPIKAIKSKEMEVDAQTDIYDEIKLLTLQVELLRYKAEQAELRAKIHEAQLRQQVKKEPVAIANTNKVNKNGLASRPTVISPTSTPSSAFANNNAKANGKKEGGANTVSYVYSVVRANGSCADILETEEIRTPESVLISSSLKQMSVCVGGLINVKHKINDESPYEVLEINHPSSVVLKQKNGTKELVWR